MKVKVVSKHPSHEQLGPMQEAAGELRDMGVSFTTDKPDLLLLHTYRMARHELDGHLKAGIPTVILERVASAGVVSRANIQLPHVGAVAKSTAFRDWRTNNAPLIDGRYHYHLLAGAGQPHPQPICAEHAEKLELWYHFGFYKRMRPFMKADLSTTRKYAASFAGTVKYGSSVLSRHRQACVNLLNHSGLPVAAHNSRAWTGKRYLEVLEHSKVAPSPWGLGEKCYRDFEGLYAGCVVVKPDTSHVIDCTDTYHPDNKFIVACRIDQTDLPGIVATIANHWDDYLTWRQEARDRMMTVCTDRQYVANLVHGVLTRGLERCR